MKNIKENSMLRNVIPIQALTEENSTHEPFLFLFCFKFGKEATQILKRMIGANWARSKLATLSLEVSLISLMITTWQTL